MQEYMKYRHELKFLLPEYDLSILEQKVSAVCKRDRYVNPDGSYHIRSIYFDTFDDQYLEENLAGVNCRKKFRVRIYNCQDDMIKLECKRTRNGLKQKQVCTIAKEQCSKFMAGSILMPVQEHQEVVRLMQYEHMTKLLQPKVVVEYVRTPFVHEMGNVRITFDRSIASSSAIDLFFDKHMPKRMVLPPQTGILEVKYDEVLPNVILELLNAGCLLHRTSFSKYAICRKNHL